MLRSEGKNILMVEGDFGLDLEMRLIDGEISESDLFKITIKDKVNGETLIEKIYDNIKESKFNFSLTKEESELLSVGYYVYGIDWYQDNVFMGNLIKAEEFIVEEKV